MKVVGRKFFERDTLEVAKDLLGCFLIRKVGRKTIRAMIVETEGYVGEDDLASHASKGRTKRTEVMYGKAGHAYVYMIYGMYFCLNIVTEQKGFPAAVLIRAVTIEGVDYKTTNGPGKVCRELKIGKQFHNYDVTKGEKLWIESGKKGEIKHIVAAKRVGIDYAKHCKEYLWRFVLKIEDSKVLEK